MQIYRVGGGVRDELLGLPVHDHDYVVVGATPQEMLAQGYRQVGRDFPVFLHPTTQAEYALARTERKTGAGHTGFVVHAAPEVTLREDLQRRDLTINAMARDAAGNLIDPYHGHADLEQRLLRHVSPAFSEDPLRVLRVARFAARFAPLGFTIAPATLDLMAQMVASGELDTLPAERVWAECARALLADTPAVFFTTLRACGALARLFPEINQLFGVPQPPQWHPEIDTGVHVMLVIDQAARLSPEPIVRFAALCHDLGKGTTPPDLWPSHPGHEERSVALTRDFCARWRVPNDYRDLALLTARWHGHIHKVDALRDATLHDTLAALDAWRRPERFELFLLACEADYRGRPGFEERPYPQRAYCRAARLVTAQVALQPLLEAGYRHEELRDQLRQRRIAALAALRAAQGSEEQKNPPLPLL